MPTVRPGPGRPAKTLATQDIPLGAIELPLRPALPWSPRAHDASLPVLLSPDPDGPTYGRYQVILGGARCLLAAERGDRTVRAHCLPLAPASVDLASRPDRLPQASPIDGLLAAMQLRQAGMGLRDLCRHLGFRSRSELSRMLAMMTLAPLRSAVVDGRLDIGHALVLHRAGVTGPALEDWLARCAHGRWSAAQLRRRLAGADDRAGKVEADPDIAAFADQVQQRLAAPVAITQDGEAWQAEIGWFDLEGLAGILARLSAVDTGAAAGPAKMRTLRLEGLTAGELTALLDPGGR